MKNAAEKIAALRGRMKEEGLDGFLIPKADEYQGEFLAPYAERLKWLTGFTGSAGVAIVLADKACVLTDGRYSLQIDQQVDTDIFQTGDSVKYGAHGWLDEHTESDVIIGYDPWLHTPDQIQKIKDEVKHVELKAVAKNLLDEIWADQPEKPCGKVQGFNKKIAGKSFQEKKKEVSEIIKREGARAAIITLPDSIAWLLNIRGSDINYIPSVLSYAVVYADEARAVEWIVDPQKVSGLALDNGINVATLDVLKGLEGPVLLDFMRSSVWFKNEVEAQGGEVINAKDPAVDPKAIKSDAEFEAIKRAHILDGIALTKFLHWAQTTKSFTEIEVDTKLQELRGEAASYKKASFPTIAGFGANGAIVHYRATEESSVNIEGDGLLLVDSGGQYYGDGLAGTTDITRTMAIGQPSAEMIKHFTLVLKGHIALAKAHFPEGTTGKQIDTLARQPLWDEDLDYAHGTGHGVGCYLAVHEEAAGISPRGKDAFKPGMLISNEPGYYKDGEYGIRIENLVFVKEAGRAADTGAQMLEFETVSYAPIDRKLIDAQLLTKEERAWLNAYHERVYELVSPGLTVDEQEWLKFETAAL